MHRRRGIALLVVALFSAAPLARQVNTAQRAWITILSTTDLHGNILPIDYYTMQPDARGVAKVATLVRQIRKENPGGTLLLNSGDTIQGAPLAYVHNTRNNTPPDPMMLAMNAIGVDAMAVGNHEYNFGLAVLEKARREAKFPWLSANTYDTATGQPHYAPYIIKEMQGVRVGVLGLTTPGVPSWDDPKNYAGLEFREPLAEAKTWVARLRTEEHADLVIVAMHMGLEEDLATGAVYPGQVPNENQALAIARQLDGVDVIVMGHTHRDVPALVVQTTLLTQASAWGRHLARADVYMEKDAKGQWRTAAKHARTIAVTETTPVDPEIARLAEPYDRETRAFLSRVIGQSDADLTVEDSTTRDTALLDLVHRVQLDNYRVNGGGGYSMYRGAPELFRSSKEIRELIVEWVEENKTVPAEATGNWRLVAASP